MAALFANLKARPLVLRAIVMLLYGIISFVLIYWIGAQALGNPILGLILEGVWLFHLIIVANLIAHGQVEFFTLAVIGLLPGLLKNLMAAFNLY
jgi:hypothetical protein